MTAWGHRSRTGSGTRRSGAATTMPSVSQTRNTKTQTKHDNSASKQTDVLPEVHGLRVRVAPHATARAHAVVAHHSRGGSGSSSGHLRDIRIYAQRSSATTAECRVAIFTRDGSSSCGGRRLMQPKRQRHRGPLRRPRIESVS